MLVTIDHSSLCGADLLTLLRPIAVPCAQVWWQWRCPWCYVHATKLKMANIIKPQMARCFDAVGKLRPTGCTASSQPVHSKQIKGPPINPLTTWYQIQSCGDTTSAYGVQ